MPIQIYSVQTRGYNMGGSQRCNSKDEADTIYNVMLDAVTNDKPLVELELNGNKICFRTKDLTGFGIMVHVEETPEEIKAREIARIEQGYTNYPNAISYQGECTKSAYIGGGLI
jgi:hypothetical protein